MFGGFEGKPEGHHHLILWFVLLFYFFFGGVPEKQTPQSLTSLQNCIATNTGQVDFSANEPANLSPEGGGVSFGLL